MIVTERTRTPWIAPTQVAIVPPNGKIRPRRSAICAQHCCRCHVPQLPPRPSHRHRPAERRFAKSWQIRHQQPVVARQHVDVVRPEVPPTIPHRRGAAPAPVPSPHTTATPWFPRPHGVSVRHAVRSGRSRRLPAQSRSDRSSGFHLRIFVEGYGRRRDIVKVRPTELRNARNQTKMTIIFISDVHQQWHCVEEDAASHHWIGCRRPPFCSATSRLRTAARRVGRATARTAASMSTGSSATMTTTAAPGCGPALVEPDRSPRTTQGAPARAGRRDCRRAHRRSRQDVPAHASGNRPSRHACSAAHNCPRPCPPGFQAGPRQENTSVR